MARSLSAYALEHRDELFLLLRGYLAVGKRLLTAPDVARVFREFLADRPDSSLTDETFRWFIGSVHEAVIERPYVLFALRPQIARWRYLRVDAETIALEGIGLADYLASKERLVNSPSSQGHGEDEWNLEIDLGPFGRHFPRLQETRSIGNGVEFLNRKLSAQLFSDTERGLGQLFRFLSLHQYGGEQLMLTPQITTVDGLRRALRAADEYLRTRPSNALWNDVAPRLHGMGFARGWGRNVEGVRDTMGLLSDILEAPDPTVLGRFLARIPMIFRLAILSPHGYFGQANVLGLPDTGGQVVYILDQVRSIEREMRQRLWSQGLDIEPEIVVVTRLIPECGGTSCNVRVEPIVGTRNARILRVPFRTPSGEVVPQWISRFFIWPYLERFAGEAARDMQAELGGRPDLIVGNYSDGNLVATLMSRALGVTQCNIAHALEKTKYEMADLYWKDYEDRYHFSAQITADLISMNAADFIITSSFQEIAGNENGVGQYESYGVFTMPGLYRVVNGVDVFDPRFNIVSPGADADVYFPHSDEGRRLPALHPEIEELIFGPDDAPDRLGALENRDLPLLFTISRIDKIKNVTGLLELYGQSEALRERANLLVVGGFIDPNLSADDDEREQIEHMHALIERYDLAGQVRWLGKHLEKVLVGELYRCVADRRGAFVQPALYEAFGLTVIEAMSSGLPTFATCHGGPQEIIEDGVSGFHIDPYNGEEAAERMVAFFDRSAEDSGYWDRISAATLKRVETRYTWKLYAERMMTLSRIYGFWRFVSDLERAETRRYLDMFYGLQFRPIAAAIPI